MTYAPVPHHVAPAGAGRSAADGYSISYLEKEAADSRSEHITLPSLERASFPSEHVGGQAQAPVWTRPAKVFMVSISLFVVSTVSLLVYLIHIQHVAMQGYYASVAQDDVWINYVLQGQTVMAEFILLLIAYHAVATQNMISVLAVLGFNISLVISGVLEVVQRHETFLSMEKSIWWNSISDIYGPASKAAVAETDRQVAFILWFIPAIDLTFHLGCDWAAWLLYKELGWVVYKKVSADLGVRARYKHVLILRSLQLLQAIMAVHLVYYILTIHHLTDVTGTPFRMGGFGQRLPRAPAVYFYIIPSIISVFPAIFAVTVGAERESRFALTLGLFSQILMAVLLPTAFFQNRAHPSVYWDHAGATAGARTQLVANLWKASFHLALFLLFSVGSVIWTVIVWSGFGSGLKDVFQRKVTSHESVNLDAE